MAGQPRAPFFIVLALVVLGLIAFAVYKSGIIGGNEQNLPGPGEESKKAVSHGETSPDAPDGASITTVKEYSFRPAERLPEVKGISAYKPLVENTVRFSLNVWAGWGPIILANEGFKAGHAWKTPDGQDFKVELVLIDNP